MRPRLLPLVLLLFLSAPVVAEDARPTPGGFTWEGVVRQAGRKTADLVLSAAPATVDGKPGWRVRDALAYLDADAGTAVTDAELDGTFRIVRGTYERRNAAGFLKARFAWDDARGRYVLHHQTPEYENDLEAAGPQGRGLLSGLLLSARHVPTAEAGTWQFSDFDPDPTGGDGYLMPAELRGHGRLPWAHGDDVVERASVFTYARGHTEFRFALDERRAFLGLEVVGLDVAVTAPDVTRVGTPDGDRRAATPNEQARRAADEIRAALPVATKPFVFEGVLRLGPYVVGSVTLRADPASVDGEPALLVTETTVREGGAARVVTGTSGLIAQDLALIRGESTLVSPSARTTSVYRREGASITTRHHTAQGDGEPITQAARAGVTVGLVAVLRFLQAVPARPARYVLRRFDPRFVTPPKAGGGKLPVDFADLKIDVDVHRPGPLDRSRPALVARCTARTGRHYVVSLEPGSRGILMIEGVMPRLDILPKGGGGRTVDFYDHVESPAPDAYAALITFGRGYHLPREDLLAAAFHWPSMRAHEIAAGTYPEATPLETIRADWIRELVSRSKHRTLADCDDLLMQILMTSTETRNADGTVVLHTLPVYGGHHYRFADTGDGWQIVSVD